MIPRSWPRPSISKETLAAIFRISKGSKIRLYWDNSKSHFENTIRERKNQTLASKTNLICNAPKLNSLTYFPLLYEEEARFSCTNIAMT